MVDATREAISVALAAVAEVEDEVAVRQLAEAVGPMIDFVDEISPHGGAGATAAAAAEATVFRATPACL